MVESFTAVKSSRSRTYVSNDEIDRRNMTDAQKVKLGQDIERGKPWMRSTRQPPGSTAVTGDLLRPLSSRIMCDLRPTTMAEKETLHLASCETPHHPFTPVSWTENSPSWGNDRGRDPDPNSDHPGRSRKCRAEIILARIELEHRAA